MVNKAEMVSTVARRTGLPKKEVREVLDALFDPVGGVIIAALNSGKSVNISGFGKFERRSRAARSGVDPRSGDRIQVPASKSPGFRAGKTLKDNLR